MTSQAQENMPRSAIKDCVRTAAVAVALTLPAIAAQAQQVYKWVDAQGRVQYSERKPTEANVPTTELKPPPPPQPVAPPPPPPPKSELSRPVVNAPPPWERPEPPRALSQGLNRETDAYRCALAKDILSGAVRRSRSKTDDNDRNIARSDISLFCK